MRHSTKINQAVQAMSRREVIAELHRLEPTAGWNTAATGTRLLRI